MASSQSMCKKYLTPGQLFFEFLWSLLNIKIGFFHSAHRDSCVTSSRTLEIKVSDCYFEEVSIHCKKLYTGLCSMYIPQHTSASVEDVVQDLLVSGCLVVRLRSFVRLRLDALVLALLHCDSVSKGNHFLPASRLIMFHSTVFIVETLIF